MKTMKNGRVSGVEYRVSSKSNGVSRVAPSSAQPARPATTLAYDHQIGCYRWTVKGKA